MEDKIKIIIGVVIIAIAVGCSWLLWQPQTPDGGDVTPTDNRTNVTSGNVTTPTDNRTNVTMPDNKTNITLIKNSEEAIALVKEKYPEVANISRWENISVEWYHNIIVKKIENGWNLTFWNRSVDYRGSRPYYHFFLVYENGSVVKTGEGEWVEPRLLFNRSEVIASEDPLLSKYEKSDRNFTRFEIIGGDVIVYDHDRMIDYAIVELDRIHYKFNKTTGELIEKKVHWRDDLPEHLPPIISKEQAEDMVEGRDAMLYFISPESLKFPIKPTPKNPCWAVDIRGEKGYIVDVIIIDAVEGKILGHGVPPPST